MTVWTRVLAAILLLATGALVALSPQGVAYTPRPIDDAVVRLGMKGQGHGSGFVIAPHVIVTAAHVAIQAYEGIEPNDTPHQFQVKSSYAPMQFASVMWVSRSYDLAVLRTDKPMPFTREPACRDVVLGEPVMMVGYPGIADVFEPKGATATKGVIATRVQDSPVGMLGPRVLLDAVLSGGNSGGPVLDASGRVIGIAVADFGEDVPMGLDEEGKPMPPLFVRNGYAIMVPSSALCLILGRT